MIGAWLWEIGAPCALPAAALAVLGLLRILRADGWWLPTFPPGPRAAARIADIVDRMVRAERLFGDGDDVVLTDRDGLRVRVRLAERLGSVDVYAIRVAPVGQIEAAEDYFAHVSGIRSQVEELVHAARAFGSER